MKRSREKQWRKLVWYFGEWPVSSVPDWVMRFRDECLRRSRA